jgi:hypothetical protein
LNSRNLRDDSCRLRSSITQGKYYRTRIPLASRVVKLFHDVTCLECFPVHPAWRDTLSRSRSRSLRALPRSLTWRQADPLLLLRLRPSHYGRLDTSGSVYEKLPSRPGAVRVRREERTPKELSATARVALYSGRISIRETQADQRERLTWCYSQKERERQIRSERVRQIRQGRRDRTHRSRLAVTSRHRTKPIASYVEVNYCRCFRVIHW